MKCFNSKYKQEPSSEKGSRMKYGGAQSTEDYMGGGFSHHFIPDYSDQGGLYGKVNRNYGI